MLVSLQDDGADLAESRLQHIGQQTGLILARRWPGAALFCRSLDAILLSDQSGAFLGRAWHGDDPPYPAVTAEEAAAILERWKGTEISRKLWGDFVTIRVDREQPASFRLHRSAMGHLPCYYHMSRSGELVVCSLVRDGLAAIGERPTVAWEQVAHHLARGQLRLDATCLEGFNELAGGCELVFEQCRAPAIIRRWNPWSFAHPDVWIASEDEAASRLRTVIAGVIAAQASHHSHLLLGLSGGLDSSIVAAGLQACGARFSAINLVTSDPTGDERDYAAIASQATGADLHLAPESEALIDWRYSDAAHLPRPVAASFTQAGDRQHQHLARRLGASGYVTGGGGDHIFCYTQSSTPLLDCLRHYGLGRRALRTSLDIARSADVSLGNVWQAALRRSLRSSNSYRWTADVSYLGDDAARAVVEPPRHGWGDAPPNIPPGKAMHVAWLQHAQNHLEGYGRERELPLEWPLLAQPVVELCLRIPSWMWIAGGQNRAVARRAFRGVLPDILLDRKSKGSPESVLIRTYQASRETILATLQSGYLARHGLLDIASLRMIPGREAGFRSVDYRRIMTLLDVEIWLQSWSGG